MKGLAGRHAVEDLDAADFNQAITAQRVEAGCFGIENDFAHGSRKTSNRGESGSPPRHLTSLIQDVPNSCAHRIEAMRGIHDEIGALALFGVGHLPRQNDIELFVGHVVARQNPLALDFRRRRDHHNRIDVLLAAGLEQQGHINHRDGGAGLFGRARNF